jgi:pilus assembly protein CpaC
MMTIRKILFAVLLVATFAYSCVLLSQDNANQSNNNNAAVDQAQPGGEAEPAKPEKKKLKKKIKVKYRDINVVMGVRKELYLNFRIGKDTVRQPTSPNVFKFEVNTKEEDPNLQKDRIVFTGIAPGITDLWVYDTQDVLRYVFNVTVTEKNLRRIFLFLKREFRGIEGLKMYIREKRIYLDGEILLPEDIARIHQVIGGGDYPSDVFKVQYRLSPTLFKVVAQKMQEEINVPTVQVEVVNQRFVLKGEVKSEEEYKDVVLKATLYLPKYFYTPLVGDPSGAGEMTMPAEGFRDKPIIDYFVKVIEPDKPIAKVVKISVYFVEIQKGFENDFGFSWAPSINTNNTNANLTWSSIPPDANNNNSTLATTGVTITGIINNFIPKLMDAVSNNKGRVIQSAAITVEDTKTGKISKKTKYPYTVQTQNSLTTQTADVGISVDLTPKIWNDAQKSEDLNLDVKINVGEVVGTASGTTIPIVSEDVIETLINIKSGDTAAIGGLVQNNLSKSYMDGSNDPNVIVSLSRSKTFIKGKSQFVVFITPQILGTASEGSDSVKEKFRVK